MRLSDEDQQLMRAIITDLVDVTSKMGPMLLLNAGFTDRDWKVLRAIRVPRRKRAGKRKLTKREIADHILQSTREDEIGGVFQRLVDAAADFSAFDLSYDRDVAQAVVARARARSASLAVQRREQAERVGVVSMDSARGQREQARERLLGRFDALFFSKEVHARGRLLEGVLDDACRIWGLQSTGPFTRHQGMEQIDGGFVVGPTAYTVECKWCSPLVDRKEVDVLMKKDERSADPNMWGLLLSINGWAETVERAIAMDRHTKNIILMDGQDLRHALTGEIDFVALIQGKTFHSRFHCRAYVSAAELLREQ